MKVLVVLSAVVACCMAKPGIALGGIPYSGLGLPYAGLGLPYAGLGLPYGLASPYTYGVRTIAAPQLIAAPAVRTIAAPVVAAPVVPAAIKTQYHSQDELGQATYGHTEPLQTHHAVQDAFGNRVGSYSYLNPTDGKIHRTDYVADALGYRVAANDLPVAPVDTGVAPVDTGVAPAPVQDTPEVVAARTAHLAEIAAAKSRSRRSVVLSHTPASTAPLLTAPILSYAAAPAISYAAAPAISYAAAPAISYAAAPAISYAAAPAISYAAAPAVREATLTTIVNNPGHAVSYRVD